MKVKCNLDPGLVLRSCAVGHDDQVTKCLLHTITNMLQSGDGGFSFFKLYIV
jgi:hypothetical protein